MLGAFRDRADGRFKVKFNGVNVNFFLGVYGAKSRDGMSGIGDAKLAAKGDRGHASMMIRDVQDLWVGDRAQQIADQTVELGISDEMSRLLIAQRSSQNARKTKQ
jgi:hypothetical protein